MSDTRGKEAGAAPEAKAGPGFLASERPPP
jgi:hypothetical protein